MSTIVAIVGRPNVGKSTFFNRLIQRREAIVDAVSGVTRDRHYGKTDWNGREFTVIDTGGYVVGSDDVFEAEIDKQVELAIDEADAIIFMVDVENGVTGMDEEVANLLRKVKKPVFMEEIENHLYLFDDKKTLFIFDLFGALIHEINNFSKHALLAKNNTKLWSIENQISYRFEDDFSKTSIAKIPIDNIDNFKLSENYIYIQSNMSIHIYSIDKKK